MTLPVTDATAGNQASIANLAVITPELPPLPTLKDQTTWHSQQDFLGAMGGHGTIQKSCQLSGVNRESVRRWRNDDVLGFAERFQAAVAAYGDYLEDMVHDRLENPTGNRGSDVLLMARLNAERPEKWSRNIKLTHDVPNELIQQLRALQQLGAQESAALEPGKVVEGEAKPLPWEE